VEPTAATRLGWPRFGGGRVTWGRVHREQRGRRWWAEFAGGCWFDPDRACSPDRQVPRTSGS